MKAKILLAAAVGGALCVLNAGELKVAAQRVAADRATGALVASGDVVAVSHPYTLRGPSCERNASGVTHFVDPTQVTTCTNAPGHLHWSLTGEAEHSPSDYIWMKGAVLRFWEIPVFWMPYFFYPLDSDTGWRIMPGYTGDWGAFLLTKYVYNIAGDPFHDDGNYWLYGSTRFDLRSENGLALGETLHWGLGDYGKGFFKIYYAWDEDASRYDRHWNDGENNYEHWSSDIPYDRYAMHLEHKWEVTERDILRLSGTIYSDSRFRSDFDNTSFFNRHRQSYGSSGNEIAWEHVETWYGLGASVSGPLNDFYPGTSRLPELYFDVAPTPLLASGVNYETSTRAGYLDRQAARYGKGRVTAYTYAPGEWAEYNTFRMDTYHRFSYPMKFEILSVVPRVGFRGTYWNDSGTDNLTGWGGAKSSGDAMFRSIVEGGVTFAARGYADISADCRHVVEPYFDVLLQEAMYSGDSNGNRPYVYDSIDASRDWFDQFAGRSRNLPYSYYGVTPGIRNAFQMTDETGHRRTVFDFDAYVALQFNSADWTKGDDCHKLSKPGEPNYGNGSMLAVPGIRLRYSPDDRTQIGLSGEFDSDSGKIACAQLRVSRYVTDDFSWYSEMRASDYRYWDFSSTPYDPTSMSEDEFNLMHFMYFEAGFKHEICDAIEWSPFISWDCRLEELDSVGAWIDFRTDCLGFRLMLEYVNEYTRIDDSTNEDDFSVGFYIYLRAFGASSGSVFGQ